MAVKRLTTADKAEIIRLRVAGYPIRTIAERTGRSTSTVQRVINDNPVNLSSLPVETLTAVKSEFERIIDPEWLATVAARQTLRLVSQQDQLQNRIDSALVEQDHYSFSVQARAITAMSTALSNLSKTYQDLLPKPEDDELPVLEVRVLTPDDIAEMREQQRLESELMNPPVTTESNDYVSDN